jgi:hypothetical protein
VGFLVSLRKEEEEEPGDNNRLLSTRKVPANKYPLRTTDLTKFPELKKRDLVLVLLDLLSINFFL